MKTLQIFSTLAALVILTNMTIACDDNRTDSMQRGSAKYALSSFYTFGNDGDQISAEKKKPVEPKGNTPEAVVPVVIEKDLSYLRFDIDKYIGESESEITDLPQSEFEYLRFDVNTFIEQNPVDADDLPVNEHEYLRFNVDQYYTSGSTSTSGFGELPE